MKTGILAIFATLLLTSTDSNANLRAPLNIPRSPSSALYQITNDTRVLQEKMTVDCDWQNCDVEVKYLIETNKPISASVDFMIPAEADISVKIGQNPVPVQKKSVPYGKDPREQDREVRQFFDKKNTPLFKASFPLTVRKGQHEILIQYRQPLSQEERGYGYFSKGYYIGVFQYELWPLNEWNVSKDFQLDLNIHLKAEALGDWWDSLFNNAGIDCFTVTFKRCSNEQSSGNQLCKTVKNLAAVKDSNHLEITEQIHAPFPDRLFCQISPK